MLAKYYWLQECIQAGVLTVEKIRGAVNPADLMTKHLNGATMRDMCALLGLKSEAGRALGRRSLMLTAATCLALRSFLLP